MSTKDPQEVWRTTLAQIEIKLDAPATYKTFFQGTELVSIDGSTATIRVPNPYTSDWLQQRYRPLIKDTIAHVYGKELSIEFVVQSAWGEDTKTTYIESQPVTVESSLLNIEDGVHASVTQAIKDSGLNTKHAMRNFIVGESNRIAHAASQAVVENTGGAYNPLFIYGSTGVGKTHLAQAIGRAVIERNPSKKVIYTTSEGFLNDMVKGLKTNKMAQFRARYRPTSVLIIDDIQMISKWVATQGEFFNTFNEMHNNNSQIILIADRRPEEIKDIEERLRSRFQGGLVASIEKPDYELRLAILQRRAAESNIDVSDRLLEVIARNISENIRELEGALQTVALFNQMRPGGELTTEEVIQIIGKDSKSKREKVKVPAVLKTVAKSFGVSVKDLKGPRRTQEIARARQVAMYILREEFQYKLEEVAQFLNRSDHTTVIHAVDKISSEILTTDGFKDQIVGLIRKLNESTVENLS